MFPFIQRKKGALESPEICVHNARSLQVEPVAKRRRKSMEQATFSTFVLIATETRPQAADLVHESEPLDAKAPSGSSSS